MILLSSSARLRRKCPKSQSAAKRIRLIAGALAISICISSAAVPAFAFTYSDTRDYDAAISSTAGKYKNGDKIYTMGTPNYTEAITEDGCNYFKISGDAGDWYVATGKNTASAIKKAVPKGEALYYGTYAGKLESVKAPVLDIRGGAICIDGKVYEADKAFAVEDKELKEKERREKELKEKASDPNVYISSSGRKYHSSRSCSNMKFPRKVKKSYATEHGYSACHKCY